MSRNSLKATRIPMSMADEKKCHQIANGQPSVPRRLSPLQHELRPPVQQADSSRLDQSCQMPESGTTGRHKHPPGLRDQESTDPSGVEPDESSSMNGNAQAQDRASAPTTAHCDAQSEPCVDPSVTNPHASLSPSRDVSFDTSDASDTSQSSSLNDAVDGSDEISNLVELITGSITGSVKPPNMSDSDEILDPYTIIFKQNPLVVKPEQVRKLIGDIEYRRHRELSIYHQRVVNQLKKTFRLLIRDRDLQLDGLARAKDGTDRRAGQLEAALDERDVELEEMARVENDNRRRIELLEHAVEEYEGDIARFEKTVGDQEERLGDRQRMIDALTATISTLRSAREQGPSIDRSCRPARNAPDVNFDERKREIDAKRLERRKNNDVWYEEQRQTALARLHCWKHLGIKWVTDSLIATRNDNCQTLSFIRN